MIRKILLFLLAVIPLIGFSQTDHEFWFAAPAICETTVAPSPTILSNLNRTIAFYFTTAQAPAVVKVEQPANPSFVPIYVTVTNSTSAEILLTSFIDITENKPANTILNYGFRITSDKPVTAIYEVQSPYNAATWTLFGHNALGTEFLVPAQAHWRNNPNTSPPARNVFDIVATEDSTIVSIVPKKPIIGHAANDTFSIMLNRGQTWSGRAASGDSTAHLGGTFIFSTSPIAVTITDDAILFPENSSDQFDVAGDQLVPRHVAGTEFILADLKAAGEKPGSLVQIWAFEDSTTVTCKDSIHEFTRILNRGGCAEYSTRTDSLGKYSSSAYILSTKPVIVYFSSDHGGFPQQEQACASMVAPILCGGSRRVTFTRTPPVGVWHWFDPTIVARRGTESCFNGIFGSGFGVLPGTNGKYSRRVSGYAVGMGNTVIISNTCATFQVSVMSSDIITTNLQYAKYMMVSEMSALYLGPERRMCPGDSILLDAGYGRTSYYWSTGETTQTIRARQAGIYWVSVVQDTCVLVDSIVISYYWSQPINLGPDRQICNGDSVPLDAGPGRAWYLWSTGAITQSIRVKYSGSYWVRAPDVHWEVADTVVVTTVSPPVITSTPLSKSICTGEQTNIQLSSSVPGTIYHWTASLTSGNITGFSADSGLLINQTLINIGTTTGVVTYHITPKKGDCAGPPVDYVVMVNIGDPVDVTITASGNTVCAGTIVSFMATPVNPGTSPVYQWKVNIVNAGSNAPTFTYSPVNGDIVTCILTSSNTICTSNNPATSNSIPMLVNPLQPVSVTVSPSSNPICVGALVNFTATPCNGGTTPQYQWKVNGLIVGTNSPNYSYVPVNDDAITCTLTSNVLCPTGNPAISNTITMTVKPILPVGVSIVASSNPFCLGSAVTFTATPVNGGLIPVFQWKVNGINAGSNNPVFVYSPANSDVITCSLLSSETCTSVNPALSNPVTMVVNATLPAGITIVVSANPFCPGSAVTFTAAPLNGGSNPAYQWKVNGINAGTNSSSFSYSPMNNDSVRCVITSNLNCVTGNPASSAKIIMIGSLAPNIVFIPCFDTVTRLNAKPFKLKGGLPLGGSYSGPGVNSSTGMFTPSVAGTGMKTITYSYINVYDCSAIKLKSILVQPSPAFTCGNNLLDTRDNKVYPTVQIGSQCWMSSNLDFGSTISDLTPQTDNCIPEKYTRPASRVPRPAFYQWDELMQYQTAEGSQGLCPPGWHVPSSAEWNVLLTFLHGAGQAGGVMKDTLLTNGFNSNQNGLLYQNKTWAFITGIYAGSMYWTSTLSGSKAVARGLNEYNPSVSEYESLRSNAFSVRCVRD